TLHVAQDHGFLGAFQIHGQHGRMESFLTQQMVQLVVVELDRQRGLVTTIDDAGEAASVTQAAARSGALYGTLGCVELDRHFYYSVTSPIRDQSGVLKTFARCEGARRKSSGFSTPKLLQRMRSIPLRGIPKGRSPFAS